MSMSAILIQPKIALAKRPAVSESLLQEVLGSKLLCISHDDLFDLLVKWDEGEDGLKLRQLIGKYVSPFDLSAEKFQEMISFVSENDIDCIDHLQSRRAEHTRDVVSLLKKRFDAWARGAKLPDTCLSEYYFSDWVHFQRGPGVLVRPFAAASLVGYGVALGNSRSNFFLENSLILHKDHWVEWRLLSHIVKLLAVKLLKGTDENTDLKVLCSRDGHSDWNEVFSSKECGPIAAGTAIRCKCSRPVQGFRVSLAEGEFSLWNIRLEGIVQDR